MSSDGELQCLKEYRMPCSLSPDKIEPFQAAETAASHLTCASDDSASNHHSPSGRVPTPGSTSQLAGDGISSVGDCVDSSVSLQPVSIIDTSGVFADNLKTVEVQDNQERGYIFNMAIISPLSSNPLPADPQPPDSQVLLATKDVPQSGLSLVLPAANNTQKAVRRESLFDPKTGVARYMKLDEEIGRGSFKTVYKGFDCETGVNIAWCELMDMGRNSKTARLKFKEEVEMLKGLRHRNILQFYDSWEHNKKIVLITELMTSGTLKQYIKRFRKISVKLIGNWCRQILNGLVFLHTRTPPVIHRDLKCDNFFINGQIGRVKIGDLGLAILKPQSYARTVIGTPEFMAPEMYEEHYDESVDVYAFGMCVLEMATSEYPYKECTNPAQIYLRVTKGRKPESYQRVESVAIRDIIDSCIQTKPKDRMKAAELLQLDFFNEWSVHLDCTVTSKPAVLRFRITDDVMRNKQVQKDGEAVQFDFDMNTDNPELVAKDLVNSGYLDEGNVKVAVKVLLEKIRYFRKLRLTRSNSLNNETHTNQHLLRASSEYYNRQISDEAELIGKQKSATEPASKKMDVNGDTNGGNVTSIQRKKSVNRTSIKDSEKTRKRKAVRVLVQEIATKDSSTIVTCELHSGKATVTFSFYCDLDKAEDITMKLGEYLADSEQHSAAREQITFIIDTVQTHITQPDIAKIICDQKANSRPVSLSSTGSTADTPSHSRSNSKDLLDLKPEESDFLAGQDLQTHKDEVAAPLPLPNSNPLPHPLPNPLPNHLLSGAMDETYLRDRSTTWSSNSVSKEAKPDMGRKFSEPTVVDLPPPSAFRPSQLAMIQSTPGTPILPRKTLQSHPLQDSYEDICMHDDCKWEDKTQHLKKALDITELGKSIENIMSGQMEKNSYTGHISHQYGHRTRQLSSTSRADGEIVSPNDSLGTNSTNYNSLTCDSGFCSIMPQAVTQNIASEPVAETTKKVGRFAIGVVKERDAGFPKPPVSTSVVGAPVVRPSMPSTPTLASPLIENTTPLTVATPDVTLTPIHVAPHVPETQVINNPEIMTISDADDASTVTQTPSNLSQIGSDDGLSDSTMNQCELEQEQDDEDILQELKARQVEELEELEMKHKLEIELYKIEKRALSLYRKKCLTCSALQGKTELCPAHNVAKSLHLSSLHNIYSKRSRFQPPGTPEDRSRPPPCTAAKKLDFVSDFLRNGKHCNINEGQGQVRRIRHNSVEQLLHRVRSIDSDVASPCSPCSPESTDCPFTIPEEMDPNLNNDDEQPFQFPTVDKQQLVDLLRQDDQESVEKGKKVIKDELTTSHGSVLRSLQTMSEFSQFLSRSPLLHSQQKVVKQAIDDSRAQIMRTIHSLDT